MNKNIFSLAAIGAIGASSLVVFNNTYAKTAVNTAFTDDRFYKCVVESYNNQENESKNYEEYSLTDAELAKITAVNCSKGWTTEEKDKIVNTAGLEKLTSLTSLNLEYNQIQSIDLSKNTNLTLLNLEYNQLQNIDLSKNTKLVDVNLYHNSLTSLDLSKNTELTSLNIKGNNINSLDITNNPKIESITKTQDYHSGAYILKTNTKLQKDEKDGKYFVDLSNLLFIANGQWSYSGTYSSGTTYDKNTHIVTIENITKVSYITFADDYVGYLKISVDKSSLATNGNNESNEPNNNSGSSNNGSGNNNESGKSNGGLSINGSVGDNTGGSTKTDTEKSKDKTTPSAPNTGSSLFGGDALKFIPFILVPTGLICGFVLRFAKQRADHKVKF